MTTDDPRSRPTHVPSMLRVRDVAHRLAVSDETVRRMIARGELEARRFGRSIRVPRAAVESIEGRGQTEGHTSGAATKPASRTSATFNPAVASFAPPPSATADAMKEGLTLEPTMLRAVDVAKRWHCVVSTVHRLARSGRLPAFRIGGMVRFKLADVERVEAEGTCQEPTGAGISGEPQPPAFPVRRRSTMAGLSPEARARAIADSLRQWGYGRSSR